MAKAINSKINKLALHAKFMERAIALSKKNMNSNGGGPFGAVLVKNYKIIGEGWNQVTTKFDPTAHAEVQAIRMASRKIRDFNLEGSTMYTSCEPCPMCLAAIYWARIDIVYFANTRKDAAKIGFDDDLIYREIEKPIAKRSLEMKQFGRKNAILVFNSWMKKADKKMY